MAILIVEDDQFWGTQLSEVLADAGIQALRASTAEEALKVPVSSYDAAIIDVMLPNDPNISGITSEETRAGFQTGVALARRFRKDNPKMRIILITGDMWGSDSESWARSNGIPIVLKSEGQGAVRRGLQDLSLLSASPAPRSFIVHGHDEPALLQLKNYIQNTLHWPEPVILREQPSCGQTVIEKFEDFSGNIDVAFVLLTPDDATVSGTGKNSRRSRQNVIFELGFFYAQLGRSSGRVLVLYKGPNELPSDIHGIIWISIDNGVEAAGEQIRREVSQFC